MNRKHSKSEDEKKKKSVIYNELHYKVDVIVFCGSGDQVDNGSFPLQRCPKVDHVTLTHLL